MMSSLCHADEPVFCALFELYLGQFVPCFKCLLSLFVSMRMHFWDAGDHGQVNSMKKKKQEIR